MIRLVNFVICLVCKCSVYGTSTRFDTYLNSSSNYTSHTFTSTATAMISYGQALNYSINQSFSSENMTSFVLSDLNTEEENIVSVNVSLLGENFSTICSSGLLCSDLPVICMDCPLNNNCIYGQKAKVTCQVNQEHDCTGPREFTKLYECKYCYQTLDQFHICSNNTTCKANIYPRQRFISNCTVADGVLCLGSRKFLKLRSCNWSSGKRWRTTLLLSVTLGGLGAERFYLGQWREGLGKLFSFGGLGVWTLVDVVLVATGYLTPSDGSLYI